MGALAAAVPDRETRARAAGENFPVALRLLPARHRRHLLQVYDVVRTIDDAGDEPGATPAERLTRLDQLAGDLDALWSGSAVREPVIAALAETVAACGLHREPFDALIEANRLDQTVSRRRTWDDLVSYCTLSANPIGRLVLTIFDVRERGTLARSDDVCTALQVLEHCQDVGEDLRDRDRIYLPAAELRHHDVGLEDLSAPVASAGLRAVVACQVDRAESLLRSGDALVGELRGWARLAVAGFVAGGRATVDAMRRADHDVLGVDVAPRRSDLVRHLARVMVRR